MEPRYAPSFVEQIVRERDEAKLYQLLSVLARRATLPDELWAFARVLEWLGSIRSGVWQYYEGIDREVFERLGTWLSQVGWHEIHARYTGGMTEHLAGGNCADLDRWLDQHDAEIMTALWELVAPLTDWLKTSAGGGR
jgi:hypothetical protein